MTVKDVNRYHGATAGELSQLGTRHLLQILESARGQRHDEDGEWTGLDEEDVAWNKSQHALEAELKKVLATREDIQKPAMRIPKQEKKVMKW